tara:strand:+ start:3089 stop:3781 length:693 start_codon:yes stop_codon:yes gene_type:complete
MFYCCLLLVLLLIILIKHDKQFEGVVNQPDPDPDADQDDPVPATSTVNQGIDDGQGGTHTTESVQNMNQQQQLSELERIRRSNYSDAKGFENMMKKGICTDEPDTDKFHSCKIKKATETKPVLDLRYVNPGSDKLDNSTDYTYLSHCPEKYKETMDILVSDQIKPDPDLFKMTLDPSIPNPDNFFENKFSRGQYPGYTRNNYLDRTRYVRSKEPLPINPDFFMDGGGTYA